MSEEATDFITAVKTFTARVAEEMQTLMPPLFALYRQCRQAGLIPYPYKPFVTSRTKHLASNRRRMLAYRRGAPLRNP